MKLAEREAQIIRIQADPSESDFVRELHETLLPSRPKIEYIREVRNIAFQWQT